MKLKNAVGSTVLATLLMSPLMVNAEPVMTSAMSASDTLETTITFKLRNKAGLESFLEAVNDPSSLRYHHYLTVKQFSRRHGASLLQLAAASRYLKSQGFKVSGVSKNRLSLNVSGKVSQFENVFSTRMENYLSSATDQNRLGMRTRFHRPANDIKLPTELAAAGVLGVEGLSNQYKYHSHEIRRPDSLKLLDAQAKQSPSDSSGTSQANRSLSPFAQTSANNVTATATGSPGNYTVGDVATRYKAGSLYDAGLDGSGVTIAVATYADFLPSDAQTYWNNIGLNTKPNRIRQVHVSGGGAYGSRAGTGETTLDVQQAGGLAPFANIVVYDAPNSGQGSLDLFQRIVSDNTADIVTYSWGTPEVAASSSSRRAQNNLFMEAAAQGMSLFVAAGDAGAYDLNRSWSAPPQNGQAADANRQYNKVLTVDFPSSSAYMTAAGGTTLPVTLAASCNGGRKNIDVPSERPWAWDYLNDYYQQCQGLSPEDAYIFPVGGGGGVSIYTSRPSYQQNIAGMQNTASGQRVTDYQTGRTYVRMPANFAGRNVPDVSMNADPNTGFMTYTTVDGGQGNGSGGTSFVAPQLAGLVALGVQDSGQRLGLLNPAIYRLLSNQGYGANAPYTDISNRETNWYWSAERGYDPAVGVGTPNLGVWVRALAN